MDSIHNNQIQPSNTVPENTASQAAAPKAAAAEPKDIFTYSPKDLTKGGKVPVIIQADNAAAMKKMEDLVATNQGKVTGKLDLIGGVTAEVDPKALTSIFQSVPKNVHIFLDGRVQIPEPGLMHPAGPPAADPAGSPDAGKPPVAASLPAVGVDKVWAKGYTGKGITVAVVDTGVYPHEDLTDGNGKSRIIAFKDFVNNKTQPYDDQGHGTHVSGIVAGNGEASNGTYKGAAPDASIVGIKVLDGSGSGRFSDVIKGIQWVVQNKDKYQIRVMNLSLGGPADQSYKSDPVSQAIEKAEGAGIVPAIAAGNEGPGAKTIGSPANALDALTVGALNDKQTLDTSDDDIAGFSSRGPTPVDGLTKPDILFPGVKITAPLSPGSQLDDPSIPHVGNKYITISGTSMATPGTAGTVADLLQANPKLTPTQVKDILMKSATDLKHYPANTQGGGIVNAEKALDAALTQA